MPSASVSAIIAPAAAVVRTAADAKGTVVGSDDAQRRAATGVETVSPATATTSVVAADSRPIVRAGLSAVVTDSAELSLVDACPLDLAIRAVEAHRPGVLLIAVRANDPEPFWVVATARALDDDLRVLAVADSASVIDLREAVIAGVDSFLLTTAPVDEIQGALVATAAGERVVSAEVAMELAGTWRTSARGNASALTPRELEVVQLLAEGLTNQQIGTRLELSSRTIKTHVQHLIAKLDVPDRTGAVARALRLGLIR